MKPVYIARSTAVAARELGGEMIIMCAADSRLFSLNEVASAIWRAADGFTPLSEIIERHVCEEFAVGADEAYRDAVELIHELSAHGILRVSEQPVAEAAVESLVRS